MGKPQGIPFLIKCLEAVKDRIDSYFVIVGDGTEYSKLEDFYAGAETQGCFSFQVFTQRGL